eukprot:5463019-Pyramimonas_sp.AAC.1
MAVFACVSPTQHTVPWPRRELHLRPQWRCSHAASQHSVSQPHREPHLRPQQRCSHAYPTSSAAFGRPTGSFTLGPMAVFACVSPTQHSVSWPHWEAKRHRPETPPLKKRQSGPPS